MSRPGPSSSDIGRARPQGDFDPIDVVNPARKSTETTTTIETKGPKNPTSAPSRGAASNASASHRNPRPSTSTTRPQSQTSSKKSQSKSHTRQTGPGSSQPQAPQPQGTSAAPKSRNSLESIPLGDSPVPAPARSTAHSVVPALSQLGIAVADRKSESIGRASTRTIAHATNRCREEFDDVLQDLNCQKVHDKISDIKSHFDDWIVYCSKLNVRCGTQSLDMTLRYAAVELRQAGLKDRFQELLFPISDATTDIRKFMRPDRASDRGQVGDRVHDIRKNVFQLSRETVKLQ